jgi:ABC-2 type transport system ATP-binding protein
VAPHHDRPLGVEASSTHAIETRGLGKRFDSLIAVADLDLAVRHGEIFGLLGPNGAGKTTTIGMLTTRVVPTAGSALIDGLDVRARPSQVKRRIGVVSQTNTLDRSLSVAENLYYHGRYFGLSRSESQGRTSRLLERFRLADRADALVDTLSGGMAQRLMVARALLHEPAVLFLDEPTTGLDPQSRLALWEVLRELHAEGQTILLTTHYMEEAERLCERLAIMDHGRILALGSPAELKRGVDADTIVRVTLDEAHGEADLERLAKELAEDPSASGADVLDTTVRLFARAPAEGGGLLPRVVMRAEQAGLRIADIEVAEPSLETVFIALTGRELRE